MGWIGLTRQMLWALQVAGADRDQDGRYLVTGNISTFLGLGEETLIGDDATYFVEGRPVNLAGLMNLTSYGVRGVTVIGAR